MNILIINAYTRSNGGDAAILSVLISQLSQNWPDATITISSMEYPHQYPYFENCLNIGSIRLYCAAENRSKIIRLSHKVFMSGIEMLWSFLPKPIRKIIMPLLPGMIKDELTALEESDLVVSLGGGYLNGADNLSGNLNVKYILLPIKFAHILSKPVILAPQSFGPFGNSYQKGIVRKTLNNCALIFVREDKSVRILRDIGINKKLIVRSVDAGFAFDSTITHTAHKKNKNQLSIGITARAWLKNSDQQVYEKALASYITLMQQKHEALVSLIPQVTSDLYEDDDRIVERRICNEVKKVSRPPNLIDKKLNHHDLKLLYSDLDYTVGTRFHSVIFSLSSYVPAIAIEYEHKTGGIMHDLGLDKWVIKIEKVTAEKLIQLSEELMNEREAYVSHLQAVIPNYIAQVDQSRLLMKRVFDAFKST